MSTVDVTSHTRSVVSALVTWEVRRVGSRYEAYASVARTIGASSSWVRKFVGNSNEVKEPRITLFQNIRAAYDNLCERVELENRLDEQRLLALKGTLDATTEGFGPQDNCEVPPAVRTHRGGTENSETHQP